LTALLISDVLQGGDGCMEEDSNGKHQFSLCMLFIANKHDTHRICTMHEECGAFNQLVIVVMVAVVAAAVAMAVAAVVVRIVIGSVQDPNNT
jgi:hypothetical protein